MMSLLNTPKQTTTSRFFAPNPEVDQHIEQLLKVIDLRKNGETVDQQKQRGISYRLSYGAALAHIKELARDIAPCNELAVRLWYRQIRETMILATLVADPLSLAPNEALQWCDLIANPELAEQMAINLLGKMPKLPEIAPQLLASSDGNIRATALLALGWSLRNNILTSTNILNILPNLIPTSKETSAIEKRGISHLIRQLARSGNDGIQQATRWLQQATDANIDGWANTIEEVRTELAWLNESK
ncbi:DNA alkylation repair enzyme [Breznakibacter xylanolyticus]|uniref:DNA alkylation repair enzyme n=1 Tax=Breznakibacter xylanolyticus TaxID=990 RepID=A0A2W7NL61_9BACT|nr:DNA alkylation repair protein [Breznakibacter xylanolyticus]PZX17414.1 DNA alkylation repair enzyme [Breznakibacter xylanolyticus]